MVPILSIVFQAVSMLIAFGLPIILFILFRRKYQARAIPMVVGAVSFIIFALILEAELHKLVLAPNASGQIALLNSTPWLFVVYGALAAGVFEETGRFICFKLLRKKYTGLGTGLAYGVGHGGIEAIIIVGVSMINNIIYSTMINSGTIDTVLAVTPAEFQPALTVAVDALINTASPMFLVSGVERIFAIGIHIGLSVIVFYAATQKGRAWLFPVAILLHALVDVPAAMMQAGIISSILVVEIFVAVCSVALIGLAVQVYRKYGKPAEMAAVAADAQPKLPPYPYPAPEQTFAEEEPTIEEPQE